MDGRLYIPALGYGEVEDDASRGASCAVIEANELEDGGLGVLEVLESRRWRDARAALRSAKDAIAEGSRCYVGGKKLNCCITTSHFFKGVWQCTD